MQLHVRGRDHSYVLKPVPLRQEGRALGTLLILQDVTYLRDQDRARTNLVATLSHELRTPLTSLALLAELLRREEDTLTPKQRDVLRAILEEASRMKQLADNLLNLARGQIPLIAVQRVALDLAKIVEDVTDRFGIQAQEKKIRIETHIEKLPEMQGDPVKLSWVVSNLIGNALRYTPEGGTIQVAAGHQGNDFARLEVAIRGPASRRKFAITSSSASRSTAPMVTRPARPDSGSRSSRTSSRRMAAASSSKATMVTAAASSYNCRWERNPDGQTAHRRRREEHSPKPGAVFRFARASGERGREWSAGERDAAESRFDLVLTDFRMAEMNGLELLKEAKRIHPDTLVILMTAYATVESAVAAMKAGAYDYVTKPFSLEEIQLIVERALQLQGLQAENRELREAMDDLPLLDSRSPAMTRLLETAQPGGGERRHHPADGRERHRQERHRAADPSLEPAP